METVLLSDDGFAALSPGRREQAERNFTSSASNTVWVTDITNSWTREGWLYLAAILDLFSRRVVGWPWIPPRSRIR
jgi:transposase InsO family protein